MLWKKSTDSSCATHPTGAASGVSKGKKIDKPSGINLLKGMEKFNLIEMAAMPAAASENTRGNALGPSPSE